MTDVNIWGDAKKDLDKSKNYVGLIPGNPRYDGFELMYIKDPSPDGIGGVLDETINNITLNNASRWISKARVDNAIHIRIPFDVKIWGIYLFLEDIDRFYTQNRTRTRNIELICGDSTIIGTQFNCKILGVREIFIYINNAPKHNYYKLVFKSEEPTVTYIYKLQLYVYND